MRVMDMLDPALLATVAAVVREGSFERAARALHVTPSAVSQRVRQIEDRLGAVLVVRGQPCTATELGARLCRHAETVALLEDALRHDLPALAPAAAARTAAAPRERITLRVAVNADSLATWFMAALARFGQHDDALLDIVVDDQDHTGEWLRRGHVMAAVTSTAQPVQGCRSRRLGALRYVACATPAYLDRWFAGGVTADSVARAPSLVYDRNDRLQDRWVRRVLRKDVALPAHRVPAAQAFVDATLASVGWGMSPLPMVQDHLAQGRLRELLPGRTLDVPLYWQCTTLAVPVLDRLTQAVLQAARGMAP